MSSQERDRNVDMKPKYGHFNVTRSFLERFQNKLCYLKIGATMVSYIRCHHKIVSILFTMSRYVANREF